MTSSVQAIKRILSSVSGLRTPMAHIKKSKPSTKYWRKLKHSGREDNIWKFQSIDAHQPPLNRSDPNYKGSSWNVRVLWENREVSYEPLSIIAKSDPVTIAIYAMENDLLEFDSWKKFARLAYWQKKLLRMANQAKLQSFRTATTYHFGILIPCKHNMPWNLISSMGIIFGNDRTGFY